MSIENRRFIRFALDIPVSVIDEKGKKNEIMIRQISVGGCLIDLNNKILSVIKGDDIRLEFTLPNQNKLPLMGKPLYLDNNKWTGIKFSEITQFEQELIADIIAEILVNEGLPLTVNPFRQPPTFASSEAIKPEVLGDSTELEQLLESVAN